MRFLVSSDVETAKYLTALPNSGWVPYSTLSIAVEETPLLKSTVMRKVK